MLTIGLEFGLAEIVHVFRGLMALVTIVAVVRRRAPCRLLIGSGGERLGRWGRGRIGTSQWFVKLQNRSIFDIAGKEKRNFVVRKTKRVPIW